MDGANPEGNGFLIPPPDGHGFTGSLSSPPPSAPHSITNHHQNNTRASPESNAENDLRQVAETLSRTGKVLNAGLAQANDQGQRLRGAISRLERSNDWSSAERKRAEDDIGAFFHNLHEVLRAKEDEMLRDIKGVFEIQDEDNKRRLEELVMQGQKLSKACGAIQALNEGTANATIGSLNSPLNGLLEALESAARILEKEDELSQSEALRVSQRARPTSASEPAASGVDDRGVKLYFCHDQSIQRSIESIELTQYDTYPTVVLVGTPASIEEEAQRRRLSRGAGVESKLARLDIGGGSSGTGTKLNGDFDFVPRSRTSIASSPAPRTKEMFPQRMVSPVASPRTDGVVQNGQEFKMKAVVPYEPESDKGVIWYLGTKGNSQVFNNPALFSPTDEHLVVLRASSRIEGDLASLVGFKHYQGAFFETDSALSSWISVELPHALAPTHYTLGYYINGSDHVPRNWVLQGSQDNSSWNTLKVHENDTALDSAKSKTATWAIPQQANSSGPFRFFRIMQSGASSSGSLFLCLSMVEFYGSLFDTDSSSASSRVAEIEF